jgi:polyisoprenyl-teichoic acid--peptidoglycan teichoic acid transferase
VRIIPDSRRGMLWRFALGALIVIAFTATTTAVAGLLQFKQIATDIGISPSIKNAQVTVADPGHPQTLLLIGSDHRIGEPFNAAHTDTMMLVRIDPDSSTINVLSIPRDLKVDIPGHGTDKINDAYSDGGPNLLIKVIRQQVFPGLHVNHIVDVNFSGFSDLVDAIGCVYTDVDHRYYNNTAYTDYSSIDIQPGYQKLCGDNQSEKGALAFVRFRHTDSDIVRNARQQDFLRWAKDQYGASQLLANRDKLLRIFGAHTQTDHNLHTVDGLINIFNLVVFAAGHQVKQFPFPAIILPCGGGVTTTNAFGVQTTTGVTPCYVTADASAERSVYNQFMTPTHAAAASAHKTSVHRATPPPSAKAADLMGDLSDGQSQAAQLRHSKLPVYVPRLIANNSRYCTNATCTIGPVANSYPRGYILNDQSGKHYNAYRMTLVINPVLGQYYGVQGTEWQNPPILNSPTQTKTVNGKQLMEFFNGRKLSLVAWRTPHGVYWISNTLTDELKPPQMVGIAASFTRVR